MQIKLIAVGTKMPNWVQTGYAEYAKRIQGQFTLSLHEIPAQTQHKKRESEAMLKALGKNDRVIALHVTGKSFTTEALTTHLRTLLQQGQDISLLIGGPEGLSDDCLARSNEQWSLSGFTLPHPLVRVVIAEQLYRAQSIINGHPYHK